MKIGSFSWTLFGLCRSKEPQKPCRLSIQDSRGDEENRTTKQNSEENDMKTYCESSWTKNA